MAESIELNPLNPVCCVPVTAFAEEQASAISSDFQIFAHPVRVQLLAMLATSADRVCVCDLEAAVRVKQPTVSYHLKLLREVGLVEYERVGPWAYYQVDRERLAELQARLSSHINLWQR